MATKVTLIGWEKARNEFKQWKSSPESALPSFLNLIEQQTLSLLQQNTPKDTGELANSWRTIEKTSNTLEIGVSDDQEAKLQFVVLGTRYIPPNPFLQIVDASINNLISAGLASELSSRHRFWSPIKGKINITSTVGLTGTQFNTRRSFGRSSLNRPKTGRKGTRVRIGRRRRVGSVDKKLWKDIKLG